MRQLPKNNARSFSLEWWLGDDSKPILPTLYLFVLAGHVEITA